VRPQDGDGVSVELHCALAGLGLRRSLDDDVAKLNPLLTDVQQAEVEVHVGPSQTGQLASSHPREGRHSVERAQCRSSPCLVQEVRELVGVQMSNPLACALGNSTCAAGFTTSRLRFTASLSALLRVA
jgi:hypothetical protein